MKVKELIDRLAGFNSEKEVRFLNQGDNPVDETGYEIGRIFEISGTKEHDNVYLEEE